MIVNKSFSISFDLLPFQAIYLEKVVNVTLVITKCIFWNSTRSAVCMHGLKGFNSLIVKYSTFSYNLIGLIIQNFMYPQGAVTRLENELSWVLAGH